MKKYFKLMFIAVIAISIICPISHVSATSGALKSSSIISCNGKMYGSHGNGHWHVAVKRSSRYYATGSPISKNPCKYGVEKTYKITYKLNKGTNNKSNPSSYTSKTKTISLKNPTKKGYKFAGWYKDSKYKSKITSIKKGTTGNITLYAKWTKK